MQRAFVRSSDVILAAFLIAITAMLLVPLPTLVLDFLLVLNLSFSMLLLLAGLYMPNALALLSFPSILLLTTLFRLGLNVASTRLILSQGDAGTVIQSFGTFLIRGEIVVGLIIFLILTVVNFIVVARGAARVSEVAARFALDALPGKQMAIDSDLRAGLINASEAQRRREELRKESQLYGSMDGAMKFVQGDVVAGMFIIATNILGGMYLGLQSGLSFSEAVHTYTILTVGDGLVHQIPAILVSICAGIVVTRVSSGEGSSLGSDVQAQVFTRPGTLLFCGSLMVLIGLTPGLPKLPFITVGLFLAAFGAFQYWRGQQPSVALPLGYGGKGQFALGSGAVPGLPMGGRNELDDRGESDNFNLVVTLDAKYLYRIYANDRAGYLKWWQAFEADFYAETGLTLPRIRVVPDAGIGVWRYVISVRGTVVEEREVVPDSVLVEVNPLNADVFGLEVLAIADHPVDGSAVVWAPDTEYVERVTDAAGVATFGPLEFIAHRVAAFFIRSPEEVLSVAEVLELENHLEEQYPGLLTRTLNRDFFGAARLAELMQELVREGVSVRDAKQVVEGATAYCSSLGPQRMQEGDFDLDDAIGFLRVARKRHILARLLSPRGTLKVITLSAEFEQALEETTAVQPNGPSLALTPEISDRARKALHSLLEPMYARGIARLALLCRSDLRGRILNFLRQYGFQTAVVTFDELDPRIPIEPIARWGIN